MRFPSLISSTKLYVITRSPDPTHSPKLKAAAPPVLSLEAYRMCRPLAINCNQVRFSATHTHTHTHTAVKMLSESASKQVSKYVTLQICNVRNYDRKCLVFTCVSYAEARNIYGLDVCLSVRPSVRLSHAGTVSKRLNILSCFLHHTIAHSF